MPRLADDESPTSGMKSWVQSVLKIVMIFWAVWNEKFWCMPPRVCYFPHNVGSLSFKKRLITVSEELVFAFEWK